MSTKEKGLGPLLGVLKPMAKKYISQDNIDAVYNQVTQDIQLAEGEKSAIIITRSKTGTVIAGVYSIDTERSITRQFSVMSVEELILTLLN